MELFWSTTASARGGRGRCSCLSASSSLGHQSFNANLDERVRSTNDGQSHGFSPRSWYLCALPAEALVTRSSRPKRRIFICSFAGKQTDKAAKSWARLEHRCAREGKDRRRGVYTQLRVMRGLWCDVRWQLMSLGFPGLDCPWLDYLEARPKKKKKNVGKSIISTRRNVSMEAF